MSIDILKDLENKYQPRLLIDFIKSKYCFRVYQSVTREESDDKNFVFGENKEKDLEQLDFVIMQIESLEKLMSDIIDKKQNNVYFKVIKGCIEDIKDLKNDCDDKDGEDIAKGLVRIIDQTLMKCFLSEKLSKHIDESLKKCGFRVVNYEVGYILKDDDFKYVGVPLRRGVKDVKDVNRILNKTYDAYVVDYYDDEDMLYPAIICGKYEVGVREE